jgi:hypothetical protein
MNRLFSPTCELSGAPNDLEPIGVAGILVHVQRDSRLLSRFDTR